MSKVNFSTDNILGSKATTGIGAILAAVIPFATPTLDTTVIVTTVAVAVFFALIGTSKKQ